MRMNVPSIAALTCYYQYAYDMAIMASKVTSLTRVSFVQLASGTTLLCSLGALPRRSVAQTLEQLIVGVMPIDSAGQVYYAHDLGYFKRAGIESKIVPFSNGATNATAVLSDSVDVGFSNVVSLAVAHLRGLPVTILASGPMSYGFNAAGHTAPTAGILAVKKSSPYRKAEDLNGKTIAVSGLANLPQLAVRAWIDKNGGDSATAKFVELPLSVMSSAVQAGRVDAASLDSNFDPTFGKYDDPLRRLASAYDAVSKNFCPAVWFTTTGWATKNPTLLKKFVSIMDESAIWANRHQKDSAEILGKYTHQSPDQIDATVRVIYGEKLTSDMIQPNIDIAAKYGVIKSGFPAHELISSFAL